MYTLITIFYVSIIGIIVMIVLKRREVLTGKESLVAKAGTGSDPALESVFSKIGHAISYVNKHTFIAIGHLIAFHVLRVVRGVYISVKHRFISNPRGKRLIDAVRGKGEVRDQGASVFLRRIAAKDNKR